MPDGVTSRDPIQRPTAALATVPAESSQLPPEAPNAAPLGGARGEYTRIRNVPGTTDGRPPTRARGASLATGR